MGEDSLSVQIADAINSEALDALIDLFRRNPTEKTAHTFFGGQTWLGYAAQKGKLAAVRLLVDAGLDINAGSKRDEIKPIASAAANGHCGIVKYCLDNGAVLDTDLSVKNALFSAIVGRSPKIVAMLLEAGIDSRVRYNSKTMKDMDAVAFALMRGEIECARIIANWNAAGNEDLANQMLVASHKVAEENAR